MEKTDKERSEGPNVVQKSTILVVCKGTVGDVLPVLRLLIACRYRPVELCAAWKQFLEACHFDFGELMT